jgi:hypothetical protein
VSRASLQKLREINAEALRRCAHCPQCGYALEGLPVSGLCPECGFEYFPDLVVLYGRGAGGKQTGMGNWLTVVYCIVSMAVYLLVDTRWMRAPWLPGVVILALVLVFEWYRRAMARGMPSETQLRLSPHGFAQRDGLGEATLAPWTKDRQVAWSKTWLGPGYIMKITGRPTQFVIHHPVQFQFQADEQTFRELKQRVRQYQEQAQAEAR